MPKIRPETAAKRRMQILKAAHRAFNQHGINVSMDQICAEAGVSKGNLYGYFESKDDLILAIAREQGEQIRGLTPVDTVDELINRIMPFHAGGDVSASRFELEAWTYSLSNPELRSTFQQNLQDLDRSIAMDLRRLAPAAQEPSAKSASQAAEILRIFAVGMMANTAIVDRTDPELIDSVKRLVDLLMNGRR
jgi:AcrR family transcriptional regulator